MHIGMLHDFVQSEHPGGADLTLKRLLKTAPKQVQVSWLPIDDPLQWSHLSNLIIANTRAIRNVELECLLDGKKYVKIHFDYRHVPPKIVRMAQLLVYMSPKHREDSLGEFAEFNVHVMPSLVDPDMFSPGSGRGHLWVGNYSRQKGIRNLFEYAKANQVHIDCHGYGVPRAYLEQSEYCHVKEPVPYKNMPALYKEYGTLVHLPKGPEAGSRVFIEGVLSGLDVVTNSFEGDLSYDEPYDKTKWEKRLREGPKTFWEATIKALRK